MLTLAQAERDRVFFAPFITVDEKSCCRAVEQCFTEIRDTFAAQDEVFRQAGGSFDHVCLWTVHTDERGCLVHGFYPVGLLAIFLLV